VRYDEHFLADPPRNTGEYPEGSELFATKTTRRAYDTLLPSDPAHMISAARLVTLSIAARPVAGRHIANIARSYPPESSRSLPHLSVSPEIPEPIGRQLRVTHRVLDIPVPKPRL
jgi:hypothetical protein